MGDDVKERPIPFSPQMAIARRERRKSQTRRIVKPQPDLSSLYEEAPWRTWNGNPYWIFSMNEWWLGRDVTGEMVGGPPCLVKRWTCPYGIPGDKLRELTTWATLVAHDNLKPTMLPADAPIWSYYDSDERPRGYGRLRAGRYLPLTLRHHMPLSTLEAVRVQRVQEISEEDAKAEGLDFMEPNRFAPPGGKDWMSHDAAFQSLWESVNGPESWKINPWVWVLRFEMVRQ